MKTEINISDHYRKDVIKLLCIFSSFFSNDKYNTNQLFKDVTRADVVSFLDCFRKPESIDPLHGWVGTYNTYRIHLTRFFKWLYYPDIEPGVRPYPSVIENIPSLRRKETSIYKPTDIWSEGDDVLFLKYCHSKRLRCYHTVCNC
jgi:hypothetical protein